MPMSRSPVSNLGDLWRRDPLITIPGMQRPKSPKTSEKRFNFAGGKNEDWNAVTSATTALFQRKNLATLELDLLTEKVKSVKTDKGNGVVCNLFKESILKKGMIIMREDMKEKSGHLLLDKLANAWAHLYSNVLPLLQAIFIHVQPPDGHSIRDLTLVNFRDIVVLKTKLEDTFLMDMTMTVPPRIVQMLLILQSVHDTPWPNKNYKKLENLVSYVVSPYLCSSGLRTKPSKKLPEHFQSMIDNEPEEFTKRGRPASELQLPARFAEQLQESIQRRYTFTSSHNSVDSGTGSSDFSSELSKSTSTSNI